MKKDSRARRLHGKAHPHTRGGVRQGGPGARGAGVLGHHAADVPGPDRCRHPIRVLDEVRASVKKTACCPAYG